MPFPCREAMTLGPFGLLNQAVLSFTAQPKTGTPAQSDAGPLSLGSISSARRRRRRFFCRRPQRMAAGIGDEPALYFCAPPPAWTWTVRFGCSINVAGEIRSPSMGRDRWQHHHQAVFTRTAVTVLLFSSNADVKKLDSVVERCCRSPKPRSKSELMNNLVHYKSRLLQRNTEPRGASSAGWCTQVAC